MFDFLTKEAPDFRAGAVTADNELVDDFKLSDFRGKYVVLFFYPLDFTFVCPTEILAFNEKLSEFEERGAQVIGVSVDSVYTHLAWKKTPVDKGGIGDIDYPLVSDLNKKIAESYGALLDDEKASRALFIIDREGIVRRAEFNDPSFGRSVKETLRMLDAVIHFDKFGKLCPADWEKGKQDMEGSPDGVVDYLSKFSS